MMSGSNCTEQAAHKVIWLWLVNDQSIEGVTGQYMSIHVQSTLSNY